MEAVKKMAMAAVPIAIGVCVGALLTNILWKKYVDKKIV